MSVHLRGEGVEPTGHGAADAAREGAFACGGWSPAESAAEDAGVDVEGTAARNRRREE